MGCPSARTLDSKSGERGSTPRQPATERWQSLAYCGCPENSCATAPKVRIPPVPPLVRFILSSMPCATPEQQREYQRKWLAARRDKWLAKNGPCRRCGSKVDLDIDHVIPGSQGPKISAGAGTSIWSWREDRRLAELAKCQVLCGKCHVIKSMESGERRVTTHGTAHMYQRYKCRCDICRDYKSRDNAKRKNRTR